MQKIKLAIAVCFSLAVLPSMKVWADAPIVFGHGSQVSSGTAVSTSSTAASSPASLNASATTQTPDQALVTASSGADNSSDTLSTVNQLAVMQQQIEDLRGQLELQGHTITQMQSELSQLSGGKFPPPVPNNAVSASSMDTSSPASAQSSEVATVPTSVQTASPAPAPATQQLVMADSSAPAVVAQSTAAAAASPPPAPTEIQLYQQAYNLMVAKQYTQATVELQTYLQQYPNGQYAASAHYSLGELALIQSNLPQAQAQFNLVIKQYPDSPKVADSMVKVGMIYVQQSQWKQAKAAFNAIIKQYPNTNSAQIAQQQLQQMQQAGN
ncbi:MAG: tol-pal system protein YbgF [Gammaproteobacteria bacterium]|nr:tol-pal system protein YbgF [Gammaproteobacteria bacterium]